MQHKNNHRTLYSQKRFLQIDFATMPEDVRAALQQALDSETIVPTGKPGPKKPGNAESANAKAAAVPVPEPPPVPKRALQAAQAPKKKPNKMDFNTEYNAALASNRYYIGEEDEQAEFYEENTGEVGYTEYEGADADSVPWPKPKGKGKGKKGKGSQQAGKGKGKGKDKGKSKDKGAYNVGKKGKGGGGNSGFWVPPELLAAWKGWW